MNIKLSDSIMNALGRVLSAHRNAARREALAARPSHPAFPAWLDHEAPGTSDYTSVLASEVALINALQYGSAEDAALVVRRNDNMKRLLQSHIDRLVQFAGSKLRVKQREELEDIIRLTRRMLDAVGKD